MRRRNAQTSSGNLFHFTIAGLNSTPHWGGGGVSRLSDELTEGGGAFDRFRRKFETLMGRCGGYALERGEGRCACVRVFVFAAVRLHEPRKGRSYSRAANHRHVWITASVLFTAEQKQLRR